MLDAHSTEKALRAFADEVLKRSRLNLGSYKNVKGKRRRIDNTGKLRESLAYALKVSKNSFSLEMIMEDYGEWVDAGRKAGKGAPPKKILQWVKTKPIKPRDKYGKFVKATPQAYQSLAYLINRKIKEKGIEPTNFFTDPFEKNFQKLPDEMAAAYALDVEQFLKFTTSKFENIKFVDA
jgi:hypothetical protein